MKKPISLDAQDAHDARDTRILAELQADARITFAELGRRVHLSQPAVTERLRKPESNDAITSYRATVNLAALGYGVRALVRAGRADCQHMTHFINQTSEVVNAWNITGVDSWLLEIAVADVAHLDAVVSQLSLLTETSSSIILKSVREHPVMLPCNPEPLA